VSGRSEVEGGFLKFLLSPCVLLLYVVSVVNVDCMSYSVGSVSGFRFWIDILYFNVPVRVPQNIGGGSARNSFINS